MGEPIEIRAASDSDIAEIVALCRRSLGWREGEPNEALFRWKHLDNPFGRSFLWVATAGGKIVGVRPMMRWRFDRSGGGASVEAVRAVDTATDPEFQGQGIFSRLTRHAIDELTQARIGFVFNTPNAQSRPGYVKLGWTEAGRVSIALRPTRWHRIGKLRGARVPAAKWSQRSAVGSPADTAPEALADPASADSPQLRTAGGSDFAHWRFGLKELSYTAVRSGKAQAVFRVRRRGSARECALADVFGRDSAEAASAVRELRRSVDADYVLATRSTPGLRGFIPAPRLGPRLFVRSLSTDPPRLDQLDLRLGDIELF